MRIEIYSQWIDDEVELAVTAQDRQRVTEIFEYAVQEYQSKRYQCYDTYNSFSLGNVGKVFDVCRGAAASRRDCTAARESV